MNYQFNLPAFAKKLDRAKNRLDVPERFNNPVTRLGIETDIAMLDSLETQLKRLENFLLRHVKDQDRRLFFRLKTVPGIGDILGLVILFETQTIERFPTMQQFCSYARLVKARKESAGKKAGSGGAKIGNAYLKWAFSEAAILFIRESQTAKRYIAKMTNKHGKGKALSMLAHKLGRAVYHVWRRGEAFDENYFWQQTMSG